MLIESDLPKGMQNFCCACGNENCLEHVDLGDEVDSDGQFGNNRIQCTVCGLRTADMDTLEDAVEAWNEQVELFFLGSDAILVKTETLRNLCKFRDIYEGCRKGFCHDCKRAGDLRQLY